MALDKNISYPDYSKNIRYKIIIDGQEINDYFEYIISISTHCGFNKISSLEIVLNNIVDEVNEIFLADKAVFGINKQIEVFVGYDEASNCIFKGTIITKNITNLCSVLTITAKNDAEKLTKSRKLICYKEKKDDEIIQSICSKEKIDCDIESTKISNEKVVQYNSTDWDFINMRAEANGLILFNNQDGIFAKAPNFNNDIKLNLIRGYNIIDIEEELDIRHSHKSYNIDGWNYTDQNIEKKSSYHDNLIQNKEEQSKEETLDLISFCTQEDNFNDVYQESQSIRNDLSFMKGKITTLGYAPIEPMDIVNLCKVGKSFNGKAIVSNVVHSIKNGSWKTMLDLGYDDTSYICKYSDVETKPLMGMSVGVNGLQYAKVESLEGDPLNEGRIYINLIGSTDTKLWARIATLDAGNNRGSFFIPEINDEVIVGFIDNNPNQPIILGSLHSNKSKQPCEIKDENYIKTYVSKENIKITIDDENKALYFETPGGNKLSLNDKEKGICLEDQNGNKITLNDQGISIESQKALTIKANQDVNIEGNNMTLKANAQLKAQGMSSEVSASGNLVIKGGIVQIN